MCVCVLALGSSDSSRGEHISLEREEVRWGEIVQAQTDTKVRAMSFKQELKTMRQ